MHITAHRGFGGAYPQNTAEAFARASERADAVEIDVRRCGSGELVASHFDRLRITTDGSGKLRERSLSELKQLSVDGSDATIPTLREAIDAVPADTGVMLDLKWPALAGDALAVAREFDNDLIVTSFYSDALWEAREHDPDATLAYNFDVRIERNLTSMRLFEGTYANPHWSVCLLTDAVDRAHDEGMAVHAWPVGSRWMARLLRRKGVDGLITTKPGLVEGT